MINVCKKPILFHIIEHYQKFGFRNFIIATGYKSDYIINYFKNKKSFEEIKKKSKKNLKDKHFTQIKKSSNFSIVDTGLNTMTGGRIKRLKKYIGNETFMMTYGDGLSDINLKSLLNFHKKNKKLITLTAVHPPARFGELTINDDLVRAFEEKPQLQKGWINGGFFVIEPEFLSLFGNNNVMLERQPMQKAVKTKNLAAYKHTGFWFAMDTLRDKRVLDTLIKTKKAPWLK